MKKFELERIPFVTLSSSHESSLNSGYAQTIVSSKCCEAPCFATFDTDAKMLVLMCIKCEEPVLACQPTDILPDKVVDTNVATQPVPDKVM